MKAFNKGSIRLWLIWLVVLALIFAVAWLCFMFVPQSPFRDSFLGNLFATIVGVIIGIPIALQINRAQQEAQSRNEQEAKKKEWLNHKVRLLRLIKTELEYNREALRVVIQKQDEIPRVTYIPGLKNDLWNSFSDGGELQWIDSLELLDILTTAYFHIRHIIPLEAKYLDPDFNNSVSSNGRSTYAGEQIVERVKAIRPIALQSTEHALSKIDEQLTVASAA